MRLLRGLAATALVVLLAACASRPPAPVENPDRVRERIVQLLPASLPDRAGWAADIYAAFATQAIATSAENICAVLAVTDQESNFRADPPVPNLAAIARSQIDAQAERAGVPKFAVRAALQMKSADGRSFAERIDAVRTERELSEIYEDMISVVPLGSKFLADRNPVRTGGPMQVSVAFAQQHAQAHPYPYPVARSIRNEVFTRRGGMYFGIAHLLGYEADYAEPLYRFADFNAGRYASRNAAFQRALSRIAGVSIVADGDLLPPNRDADAPLGETERVATAVAQTLGLSPGAIRRDLEQGEQREFEATRLYQRVFDRADAMQGGAFPRAAIPTIELKSPKFTRKLTTEWFARRVDERYRRCLARVPSD